LQLQPHHIGIIVRDIDRSVAFYEALGFRVSSVIESDDGSRTITFMELGGSYIELFCYAETPMRADLGEKHLGFVHYALLTDDVDGALAELKARDFVPDAVESRRVPAGFKVAFFYDPDGVEIELTQSDRVSAAV